MTTLEEKMSRLPLGRRAKIEERATQLRAEETSLQQLRAAHRKTQLKVAETLGIGQEGVSRLERRSDMLISTLREYVAALGGSMRLVVEFEGRPQFELQNLGMLTEALPQHPTSRKKALRPAKAVAASSS